jgi:hypothetical protein
MEIIMTTTVMASNDANSSSEQFQAIALWTFVHLKTPRFTSEVALEVIRQLMPINDEDPKRLAKRLRAALRNHGVELKHVNALGAAARLLGQANWHAAHNAQPATLKLTRADGPGEELFADWHQLSPRLCEWCDAWHREKDNKVFKARFGPAYAMICVQAPKEDELQGSAGELPLLVINPMGSAERWMQDAPFAFENLRRHLEESNKAILDGVAVLQLCKQYGNTSIEHQIPQPVRPTDACNSELILLREDNELQPGSGYEIARGDELTCWGQLELAIRDHKSNEIILDDGAWRIGQGRYVWQLSTIHPKDFIPGLVITMLNEMDSRRLLRRYQLVKRIFSNQLKHQEVTKRLQYLNGPSDTYRIDLHKLLLQLDKAGLAWSDFCKEIDVQQEMTPELPVGFFMSLVKRLNIKDPNSLFALPSRSEMARADNDSLLRTLLPRIDIVRYRLTNSASNEVKQVVHEAIEEFGASIRLQAVAAAGQVISQDDPLPYLVYASDAEELRLTLEAEGLVIYASVMPHLFSTEGLVEKIPNVGPHAFGHSLYLDIDLAE